jgi:predicted MPP superfamily phosphohydrolase
MNIHLPTIVVIIMILYGVANYYSGLRGWQSYRGIPPFLRICYLFIFSVLACAYPLGSLGQVLWPSAFSDKLALTGSFWLAMIYYLFLFTLLIDLLRRINKRFSFLPKKCSQHSGLIATIVFFSTTALISYGAWNARHPVTINYEITIPKAAGSLDSLQVVLVSDLHLGKIIGNNRLTKLVNRINQLDPDIVLFAGDIIDNSVDVLPDQHMIETFSRLHPKLGTYAILGNHEYFDKKPDLAIQYMEQGNIHVLRDQWTLVANSIYLVGRDDDSKQRYTGISRQELATIMAGLDHSAPIILLDHQPLGLQAAIDQGVDLQLSGHTHLGQLFPNNFITRKIYELDWGYVKRENLQAIVSCGIGTWGPPVRIGNHPEIINLTIHFVKQNSDS